MGYEIQQRGTRFTISNEHKRAALLKLWLNRHYLGRVDYQALDSAQTLEDALRACRWDPLLDDDGNIVYIKFRGTNLGNETAIFGAIAEYVPAGCSIFMIGEDDAIWRLYFDGEKVIHQLGEIAWS